MILEKLGCTYRVNTAKKKIKDRFEDCCIEYAVGEIKEDDADSAYLKIISRGGLTVPSYSLSNYVCEAFALLNYFNEIFNKSDTSPTRMRIHIN